MKIINKTLLVSIAMLVFAFAPAMFSQTRKAGPATAEALVADLYKAQKLKRGPFFQTRSRALVDKYFTRSLGDLIWKDARSSKGEVGVIDGDPLYDAQDMEIKNFAIGQASVENGKAKVPVTFENLGDKKTLIFTLVNSSSGWRISDIDYGEGRTLVGEFKETK